MSNEDTQFFNMPHWPARLTAEQAAKVLNCQKHDITVLMREKLLAPLGNPTPNGKKFFETSEILSLADDRKWLQKMTEAIRKAWRRQNGNNQKPGDEPELAA